MTAEQAKSPWWLRIISVVAAFGLLFSVAELALRLIIPPIVATEVRDQLGLNPEHPVQVQLDGSAVLAALQQHVGPIHVQIHDVHVLEDIVATLTASAQALPFDPTRGEISGASGSVTIEAGSLDPLITLATQGLADSGEVVDGRVRVGRSTEMFGQAVTFSATLGLAIEDGDLRLTPASVSAAGFDLTAEELDEITDGALDALLGVQHLCVRDRLPRGITLTGVWFSQSGSVTVNADFTPGILSDPKQQLPGTCVEPSS